MTNKEHCEIEEIRIGNSKETLDPLSDHNSVLLDVISVFGHFIKYFVKCHSISNKKPLVNAFDILVQSQAEHNSVNFPPLLIVKNNDIRSLIQSKELCWMADEVHGGTARKTLQALCDALWCIDRSHSTLSERSCEIAEVFQKFNGTTNHKVTSIENDKLTHHQGMFFLHTPKACLQFFNALSGTVQDGLNSNNQRNTWHVHWLDMLISYWPKEFGYGIFMNQMRSFETLVKTKNMRFTKVRVSPPPYLEPVCKAIETAGPNHPVELGTLLPSNRRRRYDWLMELKNGLQVTLVHVSYAPGGSIGNLNWLWYSTAKDIDNALQSTQPLIEELKKKIPQYHTRDMRRDTYEKFGLVMPTTKKSVLRVLYKDLVGDCSASANLNESAVDERVATLLELEEPSLVYDLRDHFNGKQSKFDVFWQKSKEYLEEDIGTAVDDRRHSTVLLIAKAISVRDLHEQVSARCPDGVPIPCNEWIRLQ